MAKKETIIIELDLDTSDLLKESAKTTQSIKDLTKAQKDLKNVGQEGSIQYQKNAAALRENKKELRENNKAIDQLNIANKSAAGSNEQLKAQLSVLTKQYNGLSESERKNSEEGKALNAQINQTTTSLKENEEGVQDNRRSVGDYGKALKTTPFGSFISGIKATGKAFLANPIALIIAAIVGGLALLKEAFTSSEEGQNKYAKALAVLGSVFDNIIDVVAVVAETLVDVFTSPRKSLESFANAIKENISNRFEGLIELIPQLGKAIGQLFSGDFAEAGKTAANAVGKVALGVEDMTGKLGSAGDALSKFSKEAISEAEAAAAVADKRAKADIVERNLLVERAKLETSIAELRLRAKQEDSVSAAERRKALIEARELEDGLLQKEQEVLSLRFEAQKQENTFARSNKENKDKEAQLEAELFNNQSQRANAERTIQRELNTVNAQVRTAQKQAAAERKKEVQESINLQKLQLQIFIESQGVRAKTLQEQIAISEQVSQKEIEILNKQLENKLISQEQYNLSVLSIQNDLLLSQAEATAENAQRELDIIIEANTSKLDQNQFLTDSLLIQEQEKNANILAAQLEFEALRLEQGLVSQEEYDANIRAVKEEGAAIDQELLLEKAEADKEQRLVDIENQREIDILNRDSEFEIRQADLDRQKAQELANAESTGADTALINSKFAKIEKEIDKEKFQAKVSIASDTFGNLAEIAGKESAAGKAFAIAQTTIDTFAGAQSAFNSLAVIPIVGTALGAIAAGAAIASGIQRVNKIKNTQAPKVAKGGIFGGKPHSQGGTKGYFDDGTEIEVEKGELFAVVNKQNSGMISNLNDLNTYGGNGESFYERGGTKSFLRDGGIGINNAGGSVESDSNSASGITEAIESMPQPVVVVQDINEVQGETVSVEQRAIIS